MAEDWAADVKKHEPGADDSAIAGIVRYCGIALRNRDSSLVSFSDPTETGRVRDNFCRKKLGLTESDADIDAAIARVGERMRGDPTKNRVTVYYLIADAFGKLGLFGGAAAPAMAATPPSAVPVATGHAAAVSAPAGAQALAETPHRPGGAWRDDGPGYVGFGMAGCGLLGLIILGTAVAAMLATGRMNDGPAPVQVAAGPAPTPVAVTAAPAAPAVPEGAGVTAQDVEGKPLVSVYFDTAKTDIAPDFATVAAPIKAWVDSHPDAQLAVSGFNDPRGDAAMNAELSKNRAQAVAAALAGIGVPAGLIDLEKPPETTDTGASLEGARRVDVRVKD